MAIFGEVSTAMVTPFDQNGEVDLERVTALVEYLLLNGSDSLVVAGTTGESPTLSKNEKIQLFRHVVRVVDKRVPVIAGTGSNNTKETLALTMAAEDAGVDAIMLVAPYYNKPNQEGLYEHFVTVANATELPVMIYNVPGRTVTNIMPATVIRLSKVSNIVAVKEASGDLGAMTEIIAGTDDDFALYSGDDGLTLPALSIGAVGVISVAAHVIGKEMQEMVAAYFSGDLKKAAKLHQELSPIMDGLFMAPNPTPVKTALNIRGVDVGGVRLPLVALTAAEKANLMALFT